MNKKTLNWLLIFFLISAIFPINMFTTTTADNPPSNPSGGTIEGDSVKWENNMARLIVTPHTSTGLITQKQQASLLWKYPTMNIDVAFRFDFPISNSNIWIWRNIPHDVSVPTYGDVTKNFRLNNVTSFTPISTPESVDYGDIPSNNYYEGVSDSVTYTIGFDTFYWLNTEHTNISCNYTVYGQTGYITEQQYWYDWDNIKDSFTHTTLGGKHYYYTTFNANQDHEYIIRWEYDTPIGASGKWDLLAKRHSDSISEALVNGYYCMVDPWWSSDYSYKIPLVIDHNQIDAALVNFPVLVHFENDSTLFSHVTNDSGFDVAFTDSTETTQFNHEIDYWNWDTGNSEVDCDIWVNVTSIASDADTTFYMYYGSSGASNQEDVENTWDSNFVMVDHMTDNSTSTTTDSTIYDNDGTKMDANDPIQKTGIVSHSQEFDGTEDYIDYGRDTELAITAAITVEAWAIGTDTGENWRKMVAEAETGAGGDQDWFMAVYQNQVEFSIWVSNAQKQTARSTALSTTAFTYCVGVSDGSYIYQYVNSRFVNSAVGGTIDNEAANLFVGSRSAGDAEYWQGNIDEVRISNIARSIGWQTASYNTIANKTGANLFITAGSEESGAAPEISNPSPANGSVMVDVPVSLSITVNHATGSTMDINWRSNSSGSWVIFGVNNTVGNGTYIQTNSNFTTDATYYWNVTVAITGQTNTSDVFHFTTIDGCLAPTGFVYTVYGDDQINLSWTLGTNATHTRIQRDTGSYPADENSGTNIYNNTGTSYENTGLTASTEYYYRLWSYNSTTNTFSSSYAQGRNETKPSEPSAFTVTVKNDTKINLSWTKGSGAQNTVVRYSTTGYPVTETDGTEAYNGTSNAYSHTGLTTGTTYYYKAWSYDSSSNFSLANVTGSGKTQWTPSAVTNFVATTISTTVINLYWTDGNGTSTIIMQNDSTYPTNVNEGIEIYNGTEGSYSNTGLNVSTSYYYSAFSFNASLYSTAANALNYTLPDVPQNDTAKNGASYLNITWDNATGADTYLVIRKVDSYPTSRTDGTELYNGTNLFYNDTAKNSSCYYMLYSYNITSNMYSLGEELLWGGLTVYVYNESSNASIASWDIFIANFEGSDSNEYTGQTNGASYNIDTIPNGAQTAIIINATGYYSRVYYMDLNSNNEYTLKAYLAGTDAELYLCSVVNSYDDAIKDAKIQFQRGIGGSFVNITTLYTDANGQVNLYLYPNILYKVVITKSGYLTEYADFIPSDSIFTYTFEMEFADPNYYNVSYIDDYIIFNGNLSSTGYLMINYTDSSNLTTNTNMIIYEHNNTDGTITAIRWYNTTSSSSWTYTNSTLNASNCYEAKLYFNHTTWGAQTKDIILCNTRPHFDITTSTWFDSLFTNNYGSNPFGWSNFIGFIITIIVLLSMGQQHSGIAMIICGGILLFFNNVIGLHIMGVVVPILFIVLGILIIWRLSKNKVVG